MAFKVVRPSMCTPYHCLLRICLIDEEILTIRPGWTSKQSPITAGSAAGKHTIRATQEISMKSEPVSLTHAFLSEANKRAFMKIGRVWMEGGEIKLQNFHDLVC